VAIGNAWNAGVLAAQILATAKENEDIALKLKAYKEELRQKVLSSQLPS
jgi:phosphoribosylcarboxyaminoimidazole (NCAIR) mutase